MLIICKLLVVYAAATPLPLVAGALGGSSLAALLGTTRAAILMLAATAPTTTELARQAEVSASTASTHAKVLRECGLLTTTRDGQAVHHALTRLGQQLLTSRADGVSSLGPVRQKHLGTVSVLA